MPRYIDADKLTQRFYYLGAAFCIESVHIDSIMKYIENMPTVDAVEVVRCKDCIYKEECGREVLINECDDDKAVDITGVLFYCSYGERKGE